MARPVTIAPTNCTLIRRLIDEEGLTIREFKKKVCRKLNLKLSDMSDSFFYQMLRGEKAINDERLSAMADVLGVDFGYLKTPIGRDDDPQSRIRFD